MAEYFALIDRTVSDMADQSAEARQDVYGVARRALHRQLSAADGGFDARRAADESRSLDSAIARVELKFGSAHVARPGACASTAHATATPTAPLADTMQADVMQADAEADAEADAGSPADGSAPGRRQFAFNAASSWAVGLFKAALQLLLLPVMARLLGPTAYGIYSLAFPVVMFFVLLADGGLGASLSREDENNRVVWSTAFWLLLGICCTMGLGVVGSGFVLARMSGQPSLFGLMSFLALSLPLLAVLLPADARLLRRGNLVYHSVADLVASVAGAGVAVTLAYRGAGAWSLAAQYVTSFAIRAAILNAAAWSPPDLVFDLAAMRGHISTGGALLVSRLGELGGRFAENTAFGHVFGTAPLGAYTLANQMSRFACDAIANPVVGAFYAQALRESDGQVAALHAKLTRVVLILLLPVTALMAVAAADVFPIILGPQWVDAAPILRAVVVPYALTAAAWLSFQVLLKHGMAQRSAAVLLCCGTARVLGVGAGLWLSPSSVAWIVGGTYAVQAVAMTAAVPRALRVGLRPLLAALWAPALSAGLAAACCAAVLALAPDSLSGAAAAGAAGLAAYAALLWKLGGETLQNDVRGIRTVLKR